MEVNNAQGYAIIAGKKPQYNNSEPIPLKNSSGSNNSSNQTSSAETNSSEISEDKYKSSNDKQEESKGFLVIENFDKKPILEINNTQVKYQNKSFNNYNFYSE
ncbi:121_t:CDS:2 [Racocetra fulgida]|uniref:121_t:CDS:1 n=1 Tax=Racocetra fulgida TaxID=60492 RepID=A0A9N9ASU8_9GLOM|nr:121_t:CDS:2 [Racocetra fulgida]